MHFRGVAHFLSAYVKEIEVEAGKLQTNQLRLWRWDGPNWYGPISRIKSGGNLCDIYCC